MEREYFEDWRMARMVNDMRGIRLWMGFNVLVSVSDVLERQRLLCDFCYRLARDSRFASYRYQLFYFTGQIYEPISVGQMNRALEYCLRVKGVSASDWFRFQRDMLRSFRMGCNENKLSPEYNIIAFANGVVDVTRQELMPFSDEFHTTFRMPYKWEPKARCDCWLAFLQQVLPEKESRELLQMFLGLSLLPRSDTYPTIDNCLSLVGAGANGKGVVFDVINGVFGLDNVATRDVMPMIRGVRPDKAIAHVEGKYLNVAPIVPGKKVSSILPQFSSLMACAPQNGPSWTIYNVPHTIFSANEMPKDFADCQGFYRHFLFLIFSRIIPPDMRDGALAYKLRCEYPGIMMWIVRGMDKIRRAGYRFPRSENNLRTAYEYAARSNSVGAWLDMHAIRPDENGEWHYGTDLYRDYTRFADANALTIYSYTFFVRTLKESGFIPPDLSRRDKMGIRFKTAPFQTTNTGMRPELKTEFTLPDGSKTDYVPDPVDEDIPWDENQPLI